MHSGVRCTVPKKTILRARLRVRTTTTRVRNTHTRALARGPCDIDRKRKRYRKDYRQTHVFSTLIQLVVGKLRQQFVEFKTITTPLCYTRVMKTS